MLTEILIGATVYIVTGYTDMRKGIDGLAQIVEGSVGAVKTILRRPLVMQKMKKRIFTHSLKTETSQWTIIVPKMR